MIKRIAFLVTLILALLPVMLVSGSEPIPPGAENLPPSEFQEVSLVLDGVALNLLTPFLPAQTILLPEPGDPFQVANIVQKDPRFQSLTLTAIPYGTRNGAEIFPAIETGQVDSYREALREFRRGQGGNPQDGPSATLLDRKSLV